MRTPPHSLERGTISARIFYFSLFIVLVSAFIYTYEQTSLLEITPTTNETSTFALEQNQLSSNDLDALIPPPSNLHNTAPNGTSTISPNNSLPSPTGGITTNGIGGMGETSTNTGGSSNGGGGGNGGGTTGGSGTGTNTNIGQGVGTEQQVDQEITPGDEDIDNGGGGNGGGPNIDTDQQINRQITPGDDVSPPNSTCSNNVDDDGDGLIDYPLDPGCSSSSDSSESNSPLPAIFASSWHDYPVDSNFTKRFAWAHTFYDTAQHPHQQIINQLNALPNGERTLFYWISSYSSFYANDADNVKQPDGSFATFTANDGTTKQLRSIWMENGVIDQALWTTQFLQTLINKGAPNIDRFILDWEGGWSNWGLNNRADDYHVTSGLGATKQEARQLYYQFIQNDPRFQTEMQPVLNAWGCDFIGDILNWSAGGDCYKKWNKFMGRRKNDYVNAALWAPTKAVFPNATFSEYGRNVIQEPYGYPDLNGHQPYFGSMSPLSNSYSKIIGTHQSPPLYGDLGGITNLRLDGVNKYVFTPFNSLRYALNEYRAADLSLTNPMAPWVAAPNAVNTVLGGSEFYEELIAHVSLGAPDYLLLFNPNNGNPSNNEKRFDVMLSQFNKIAGAEIQPLYDNLIPWGDDVIITGAQSNGRKIYRFTSRDNFSANATGDTVKFDTPGSTVEFTKAAIWTGNNPDHGRWVVTDNSGSVTVTKKNQNNSASILDSQKIVPRIIFYVAISILSILGGIVILLFTRRKKL